MTEDCLFCRMIRGEIPTRKQYEDEDFLAFHDIAPQAPVHLLVIPKKHLASLNEVQAEDVQLMGKLTGLLPRLARDLGLVEGGYRVVVNSGAGAGQSVFHIHYHLLGGRPMLWPPG